MACNPVSYEDFELNNFGKLRSLQLVDDIVEKRLALVDIVECIGKVLRAESLEIRGRGIDFIVWILVRLPANLLSEPELTPIARYFGDRLKDHHSLVPGVIKGLLALIKSSNASDAAICDVLHKLFQFIVCQSQTVQDRYNIYCIIEECAKNHLNCVQIMGPDFMFGVISAMEGETDPKNLRLMFSFLPRLLSNLSNIDHLTGDIFEVFSTYFPVDFTSATKDGIFITREELAEGLSRCLSSTSNLAAESLPLILEKLDSSLRAAKVDSYILLQQCCDRVSASQLEATLGELWKMIRKDLIPPGHPSVQDEALRALTAIVGVLARNEGDQTPLNRFLDDVIISIRSLFPKPTDSLFIPSMKILEAVCPLSTVATQRVFLELEFLCKLESLSCTEQKCLMAAIIPFLRYQEAPTNSSDSLADFYLSSTESNSVEVRVLAFIALQWMVGGLIEGENRRTQLFKVLLASVQSTDSSSLSKEFYKLLRKTADNSPQTFLNEFYLPCFALYQSAAVPASVFFEAVGFVADIPTMADVSIPLIKKCISTEANKDFALGALLFVCKTAKKHDFFSDLVNKHNLLSTLLVWKTKLRDSAKLSVISEIVALIISQLDMKEQEDIIRTVLSKDQHFFVTLTDVPVKVILLEGLLGGVRIGAFIPSIEEVIRVTREAAVRCGCPTTRYSAGRLLASLCNKLDVKTASSLVNEYTKTWKKNVDHERSIALLSWYIKGAIMRSLPGIDWVISEWISIMRSQHFGRSVAVCTKLIVNEEPFFLTTKTHCVIKFLYRQRLLSYAEDIIRSTPLREPGLQDNQLLVLITLAHSVPKTALMSESTVPLFLSQAVLSSDMDIVGPALDLLKTLLEDKSEIFTDDITSLLPAILRLVTNQDSSRIRKLAISCVFLAGFYTTHRILPYKQKVLKALIPCLDDRKRIVRAEAVRARSRWCLVGAVGEDILLDS